MRIPWKPVLIVTVAVGLISVLVAQDDLRKHLLGHSAGAHLTHRNPTGHVDFSFVAEHITRKATITLNGTIDSVWPLFDPLNEGKWAPSWQPEVLYPNDGIVREGMVCRTHGMPGDNGDLVWMVTRYDTTGYRITYAVTNPERTISRYSMLEAR